MPKPELITEEHLQYLDELRESGVTNMIGATPYIQREFGVSPAEARQILTYWMETFAVRHKEK